MNSGVTALMVETLSKTAQQLSSSFPTQAVFLSLLQCMSGSGIRKGAFHDIFTLKEFHLGMFAEWQQISEGPNHPSLPSPLLCLNPLFMLFY